jgi:cardiolipin hydrolase
MHHKFAILDKSVVITGSFNWTSQAVKFNQENIIFYENKDIAKKYTEAYDNLWNSFTTVITYDFII